MHIAVCLLAVMAILVSALGWDPGFVQWSIYSACAFLLVVSLLLTALDRISGRRFLVVSFEILMLFLVGLTHWPLKAAFCIARPQLISMASSDSHKPKTAFIFEIAEIERRDRGVIYWLDRDPSGGVAFVQGDSLSQSLNEWVRIEIADNWSYVILD